MITSRERVLRALKGLAIDRAPRDLWVAASVEAHRGDEVAELRHRYPSDIVRPESRGSRGRSGMAEVGDHVDAWGCVWRVSFRGVPAELCGAPLADAAKIGAYSLPLELIEKINRGAIDRGCAATPRFVLAWPEARPCERFAALRGPDGLADLDAGGKPSRDVLDMLHDFFAREIEVWANTAVDGVVLSDSWSVSPQTWRGLLKPLYREFCEILRGRDKLVFFHSPGDPGELFDDLVELGVDALYCPPPADGASALERFRNRVTRWGGLDDPHVLQSGRPDEARSSVQRLRSALDFGRGGVIVQCDWTPGLSFDAVAAVFEQWLAPLPAHAHAR